MVVVLGVEGGGGGGGRVPGVTLWRAVVQVLRGQACNNKKFNISIFLNKTKEKNFKFSNYSVIKGHYHDKSCLTKA